MYYSFLTFTYVNVEPNKKIKILIKKILPINKKKSPFIFGVPEHVFLGKKKKKLNKDI